MMNGIKLVTWYISLRLPIIYAISLSLDPQLGSAPPAMFMSSSRENILLAAAATTNRRTGLALVNKSPKPISLTNELLSA